MKTISPHPIRLASVVPQWCLLATLVGVALGTPSLQAGTALISNTSPVRVFVPTDDSLGVSWRGASFDDSAWRSGVNGVGYETGLGGYAAQIIADSAGDWSTAGLQGENSWISGYYDKTGDADGSYQVNDFQPFPRSDGPWSPINFWDGGAWNWNPGDPPWDNIGQQAIHPNGVNSGGVEHWVVRRWRSTVSGPVTARFHVRKDNTAGNGVTGKVFHNGEEIFSKAVAGSDTAGYTNYLNLTVQAGDYLDFAHTPVGPSGDTGDGSDGSVMTVRILAGTIVPPTTPEPPGLLASSVDDWGGGAQGTRGWFYGYWDRTADADGTYNPATDFNTTDPNWTLGGGGWNLGPGDPPWDSIGQTDWHPNGDNPIHWVIRRWVCTTTGDINVRVRFAKSNTGCGNGTTLRVIHNGVEKFSRTVAGGDGTGFDTYVNLPGVVAGDFIDLALDPLGTDGRSGDGCDGSRLAANFYTGLWVPPYLASSVDDWGGGVQGNNGWYYGFYNKTLDADGVYDAAADFNWTDPNWTSDGAFWRLGPGDPPWDTIGQTEWHPNGDNNTEVHWVIKRWSSTVDGDLHCRVQFAKQNLGGGNGTTLRLFHNSVEKFRHTVAFNDGTGIDTLVDLPGVLVGDSIDFALDPLGTDGSFQDGADGSRLAVTVFPGPAPVPFVPSLRGAINTDVESPMRGVNSSVYLRFPFRVENPADLQTLKLKLKWNDGYVAYLNGTAVDKKNTPTVITGTPIADSMADWSPTGTQGANGWYNGYYDRSLDPSGAYDDINDFTLFPHDGSGYGPTDFWNGSGYDWFSGNPPWTEMYQETTHPNAPNGGAVDPANVGTHEHWVVRRWVATLDGNFKVRFRFRKTNLNCGDGVTGYIFLDGVQKYSQTIAGNDGVGRDDIVDLPDVLLGQVVDVVLSPGLGGNDFCDGSAFSAVIFEGEPAIPWNSAATSARTVDQTVVADTIDLTSYLSELKPGDNVLAIQGLSAAVDDSTFLIAAELLTEKPPTAVNDLVTTPKNQPAVFWASTLLANDTDPDGDALFVVGVNPDYLTTAGGSVRLYGETVRYTPPANYVGPDSFRYTISDGGKGQSTAAVQIDVANRCPTAEPLSLSVTQDQSVSFQLVGTDPDGDAIQFSRVAGPAHGTVVLAVLTGAGTYAPNPGYFGADSFTYKVSDGACESAVVTVSITVVPLNRPPVADASATAPVVISPNNLDAAVLLDGTRSSDPDGDVLTYAWSEGATPLATGAQASVVLAVGEHTITLTVSDGLASASATVVVQVITAAEAVESLIAKVDAADMGRKNKRPLIASLKAAGASFDRESFGSGINQLVAFQNKVRAQVAPFDEALAASLIADAQMIIDALQGP